MASEKEHIEVANSNQKHIDHLIAQNAFHDWLATVAFYKAIHVVEAAFANLRPPCHSSSHLNREERLANILRFKPIFTDYKHLSNESKNFRYFLNPPNRLTIEADPQAIVRRRAALVAIFKRRRQENARSGSPAFATLML